MERRSEPRVPPLEARHLSAWALNGLLVLVAAGCATGIVRAPSGDKMQCTVPVHKCAQMPDPLVLTTVQPMPAPGSQCYRLQFGNYVGQQLYCDPGNVTVSGSSYAGLAGALLIQTRQADVSQQAAQHLVFRPQPLPSGLSAVAEVYVAYDSRATVKPTWLQQDYVPVVDPLGGSTHVVRTSFPDRTTGVQVGQFVDLELHRRRVVNLTEFTIPGNLNGNPQFPAGLAPADRAMYVVLVKPTTRQGPCGPRPHHLHLIEDCYDVPRIDDALDVAFVSKLQSKVESSCSEVFAQLPGFVCRLPEARCERIGGCPLEQAKSSPLVDPATRFLRHSEVVFEKSHSIARIDVAGNNYTRAVSGRLHFEYDFDTSRVLQTMGVNSVALDIGTLGSFGDLSMVLSAPFEATCADNPAPVANPCDTYAVAPGTMRAELGAVQDGRLIVASGINQALQVTIDHPTRSFRLRGGPIRARVEVDGELEVVDVRVDLTGRFENFAPVADSRESMTYSECVEGRNRDPIVLDAAGSFDIYAQLPPNAYGWWEDYAQVGERFWGSSSRVTIWPHHLDYGIHHLTLEVEDSAGIVSTDPVAVRVLDTVAPVIHAPPPVYFLATGGSPVRIEIGRASAHDACSSRVLISHDGPAGLQFPAGLTTVRWTADDTRGNTATATQDVYVFTEQEQVLGDHLERVRSTLSQTVESLERCRGLLPCPVDLSGAATLLQWLIPLPETQEAGSSETFQSALEQLEVAASLLQSTDDASVDELLAARDQAIAVLQRALARLD